MKNLTDFRKTVETCLDPAPDLQVFLRILKHFQV